MTNGGFAILEICDFRFWISDLDFEFVSARPGPDPPATRLPDVGQAWLMELIS